MNPDAAQPVDNLSGKTISEVWMPVSGTFRRYALLVDALDSVDERQLYSKGHHDFDAFLAACNEWAVGEYGEGEEVFPISLRHEWWATRFFGSYHEDFGCSHFVVPVEPWERGAYPVTVADL